MEKIDTKLLPLVDKFIAGCQGGKMIRGILVVLGNEIARGGDHLGGVMASQAQPATIRGDLDREIFKVAATYEIMHSAILAHDDIIDQSPERRGQSSLFKAIGQGHYGISQAISLGDAGFFLAMKIISGANFPKERKIPALKLLSTVMLDTALGEILDLEKVDPLVVTKLKTAYYTISGPLQLGAILGGAESHLGGVKAHLIRAQREQRGVKLLNNLAKFGEGLGIAFQIQDDILDSEVDFWGGADKAKKEADKFKNKALKILPEITKDPQMSKLLEQLSKYLIERTE